MLVDSILLLVDSILLLVDSKLLLVDSKLLLVDSILLLVDSKLLLVEICGVDKHHPMGGIHSCILLLNELLHTQVFHQLSLQPISYPVYMVTSSYAQQRALLLLSTIVVQYLVCVCVCVNVVSNSSMQIL